MALEGEDLAPAPGSSNHRPLLDAIVPGLILVFSAAYAWSLRDIVNPGMNLLLLAPLLVAIWILLLVVVLKEVVPAIGLQRVRASTRKEPMRSWSGGFGPGTEAGAGLVVAATAAFALLGPGHGSLVYLASLFVYLTITGYVLGDRQPLRLTLQAALCALGLYLVMGVALGVRL